MARTVIVGDVHGCSAELDALFRKLGIVRTDRVYFVGDLIARGPDSPGVLARVRECGAAAVLGNHERRLLQARAKHELGAAKQLSFAEQQLLRELGADDWALLEALPLYLDLPEHGVRIVHAGVVPGVAIEDQDPRMVTHLRSIDESGNPSERSGPVLWGMRYQGPPHVVFGHNAVAGIQLHEWATGLDSGCVYGRELSALVLELGEKPLPVSERAAQLVSVPAARQYFTPGTHS